MKLVKFLLLLTYGIAGLALGQSAPMDPPKNQWRASIAALGQDGTTFRAGLGYRPEGSLYSFGAELGEKPLKNLHLGGKSLTGHDYSLFFRYDGMLVEPIHIYSKTAISYLDVVDHGTHEGVQAVEVEMGLSPSSDSLSLDLGSGSKFIGPHDTLSSNEHQVFEPISIFSALRLSYKF